MTGINRVRHLPCGDFVNQSERTAVERLRAKLQQNGGYWVLLSNLNHIPHPHSRSDEIDIVAIGSSGVYVIEVKHWDAAYLRRQSGTAEDEAERINAKAKRVAGKLRRQMTPGFIAARLLLTRGELHFSDDKRPQWHGVRVYGLPEYDQLLSIDGSAQLTPDQIDLAANILEPRVKIALSGDLRSFAGLINLERLPDKDDAFHRIYRGQHPTRRDRVILHLYDLSASDDKQAKELAEREFETIQRWQKSPFVPSLLDSFQEADAYPGELYFYSLVDPSAPSVAERSQDTDWDVQARLNYAVSALQALAEFHHPDESSGLTPILHRGISPDNLRVRHNNQPLFTDFRFARLQDAGTISSAQIDLGSSQPYTAPELLVNGLAGADCRSDIYALCSTLQRLFQADDPIAKEAQGFLKLGSASNPDDRPSLADLINTVDSLHGNEPGEQHQIAATLPAAEYWDEDTVVPFQSSKYKIVNRLGQGGIGQTFKVVELDVHEDEKFGTYVAKLVRDAQDGETAIRAYKQVRAYTAHSSHLSTIHEIAPTWQANHFVALMKWVPGMPLQDLTGVLSLYAEDLDEPSLESLIHRWIVDLCDALGELHRVDLVHGDVSPRNLIVDGGNLILTDYDTVTKVGEQPRGGTLPYTSPEVQNRTGIQPSDDLYALAASLFHVLTDRDPFSYGAEHCKARGLNWEGIEDFQTLRPFLDKATSADADDRFANAQAARQFLLDTQPKPELSRQDKTSPNKQPPPGEPTAEIQPLTDNEVPWLRNLLSAYPGSRHGNSETRGLDSEFATATYVETKLDEILLDDIQQGRINLIILFGNAGDGKTAFLQHLAQQLGLSDMHSSQRVWETRLDNGKQVKINLDGAAAWDGHSANELLDDLFQPFHSRDFPRDRIHIVAVNNGKLLEWIESRPEDSWLTTPLRQELLGEDAEIDPRFRLIDLNQRSLVGGMDSSQTRISADFLQRLIKRLLGGDQDPWQVCGRCTAQRRCTAWKSVQALRDPDGGPLLLTRLTELLQACHQRGEIHITARELRAALSYCFFGLHDCADLHADPDLHPPSFWQHAFDAHSPGRQGELLREMARYDPALENTPALDRLLLREPSSHPSAGDQLAQARRRAWFTHSITSPEGAIQLTNGHFQQRFRELPLMQAQQHDDLLRELCLGIARLEELPSLAFDPKYLHRGVPLRISPRTPTETALWVVKPWDRFTLEPVMPTAAAGLETLHTHLRLSYNYSNGGREVLILGMELFHLLLELNQGMQLAGIAQEGIFANLEIFTQRLAQEDARDLHGWHPTQEDQIFQLNVAMRDQRQTLVRTAL